MFNDVSHKDKIILPELVFHCCHGVLPREQVEPQEFRLAVELITDTVQAAETDDLADTIDYGEVYQTVKRIMEGPPHKLLESLVSEIAEAVLANELVMSVTVRLEKVAAPVDGGIRAILEITRTGADYGI